MEGGTGKGNFLKGHLERIGEYRIHFPSLKAHYYNVFCRKITSINLSFHLLNFQEI